MQLKTDSNEYQKKKVNNPDRSRFRVYFDPNIYQ